MFWSIVLSVIPFIIDTLPCLWTYGHPGLVFHLFDSQQAAYSTVRTVQWHFRCCDPIKQRALDLMRDFIYSFLFVRHTYILHHGSDQEPRSDQRVGSKGGGQGNEIYQYILRDKYHRQKKCSTWLCGESNINTPNNQ